MFRPWRSRPRTRCTGCVPCGRRTGHRRWPAAAARTTGSSRWPRTSRCKPGPAAARTGHRSSPPHAVTHSRRSGTSSRPPCRPSGRSRSAAAPHRRSRPARPPRPLPGTARGPRARPRCSPAGLARGPEGNAGRTRNHRSACARAARSTGWPAPGTAGARSPGTAPPLPSPQSDGHPARPAGPGTCLPGDRRTASPRRAAGQDRPPVGTRPPPGSGDRRNASHGCEPGCCTAAGHEPGRPSSGTHPAAEPSPAMPSFPRRRRPVPDHRPGRALPADRLQGLIDIPIHEHRAAVAFPLPDDSQPQVAEVPGGLQLAQRKRQAQRPVALLLVIQQAGV